MMPARLCIHYLSKSRRPSSGHRTGKGQSSPQFPRGVIPKNALNIGQLHSSLMLVDFPGVSDGKVSVYKAGDPGSIPRSGRSPGKGNGNPLHYSCLANPMDRGTWWATVHGVAKSRT